VKSQLRALIGQGIEALRANGTLPADTLPPDFVVERPKTREHGDFATNAAMLLAKAARGNPRALAQQLVAALPASDEVTRVEIAGPGFINFHLSPSAYQREVLAVLKQGEDYGRSLVGNGRTVGVEYVSANPTGPLHVGHGRAAAIGDCLARLLEANGWNAKREFYYNDGGGQIENLARSVQARAQGKTPDSPDWPEEGYRGDYIQDVANAYLAGDSVDLEGNLVTGSKDPNDLEAIRRFAVAYLRNEQNHDLAAFGVDFDIYFLESSLYRDGKVEEAVQKLVASGHTYEEGGALWLKSTDFGDDKDRVMRKSDGSYTYFVPDVAYHLSKWQRGYVRAITELGADHHGSLARVRAGLQAMDLGIPKGWPEYVLHQMVTVMRGGEEVKLSKRAGSYLTLRDLIEEAGRDATRWFLIAQARFAADLRHRPGAPAEQRQSGVLRAVRACPGVQPAAPGAGEETGLRPGRRPGPAEPAERCDLAGTDAGTLALPGSGGECGACAGAAPDRAIPARTGDRVPHLVPRHPGAGGRCGRAQRQVDPGRGGAASAGERPEPPGRVRPGKNVSGEAVDGSTTR